MEPCTLEQYQDLAKAFNTLPFAKKILTIRNSDFLELGNDYNWWVVKVKDEEIQEQLCDTGTGFDITSEWGSSEMQDLVELLGIKIVDA